MVVRKHVFAYVETYGADSRVQVKDVRVSTELGLGIETPYLFGVGYKTVVGMDGSSCELAQAGEYVTVTAAPYATISVERPQFPAGTYDPQGSCIYHARCETRIELQPCTLSPVDVYINETNKVKGLSFNETRHLHQASFSVKARRSDSQTLPSNATYTWSTPQGSPLEFPGSTAIVTNPSLCYPKCLVVWTANGQTYAGYSAAECAAIGGPITTEIVPSTDRFAKNLNYRHDLNDPTKPFYLTYFNYSHKDANGQFALAPQYAEVTQNATIKTLLQPTSGNAQHPGSVVTFDDIPNTFAVGGITPVAYEDPESLMPEDDSNAWAIVPVEGDIIIGTPIPLAPMQTICAEEAFQNATPKAHFVFNDGVISNDGTITGQPKVDITDDSGEILDPVKDANGNTTGWVPHVYAISGHKPQRLVDVSISSGGGQVNRPQPQNATLWTDIYKYRYILKDSTQQPMPGVWVQERFSTPIPPGAGYNQTGVDWWPTLLFSTLDSKLMNVADGIFGAAQNDANGYPKWFDGLYYTWMPGDSTVYMPIHTYFAGTKDSSSNGTTGTPVGTFQITFTPDAPNTQGTARQTP